ncbi:MAG: site-2 protease family protein [Clostridia bacterium]|nr:site-2 protease family protein [Clostridia bacterium]
MSVITWLLSKWTVLVAILFFGFIIMVHEAGHFSFAKLFGVKVNEFSLGMGPKLLSRKKGETTYSWRLLPIGGYVSMEGEDEASSDERAFNKKPCWQKIIIVAAGAIVNIIIGLIIICAILAVNHEDLSGTTFINYFLPEQSATQQAENVEKQEPLTEFDGLKTGDKIKKIDGKNVFYYEDIYYLSSRDFDEDGKFTATVERGGKKVTVENISTDVINRMIIVGVKTTPLTIIKDTFKESVCICRMVYLSLFDMITGKYSVKDISGPIGVVDVVSQTAEASSEAHDYTGLFKILALITINIGIMNLLPLPALDGGRLFFLFIELIRRKPLNPKYEAMVHGIGLALLLALMAVISFKDIWVLVTGG